MVAEERPEKRQEEGGDFAAQAAQRSRQSLLSEVFEFLAENKKWWLLPILIAVVLLGALVILGGTAAGPFIYTLF